MVQQVPRARAVDHVQRGRAQPRLGVSGGGGGDVDEGNRDGFELIVPFVEHPDLAEVGGFRHAVPVVVEQDARLRRLVGTGADLLADGFHVGKGRVEEMLRVQLGMSS